MLSDLRLRISTGGTQNVYEFQGRFSAHETYSIRFFVDKNRPSPWTGLATESSTYLNGKLDTQGGSSNSGSLSASGNTFTASFAHSSVAGVLK